MRNQADFLNRWPLIIFILAFITISILYNYHNSTFFRPQSFHAWRQADCASITLNYFQDSLSFFSPQVHNLTSLGGTTGSCATSEIPILYYTVSKIYALFGPHEFIIRLFNLIIWFLGLVYAMKLMQILLQDYFWSISAALAIFTAPVLIYYGNNYLTNVSALSFAIIAWYHLFRLHQQFSWLRLSFLLLMIFLAAGFKISALLSFISYFIILIISLIYTKQGYMRRDLIYFAGGFFAIFLILVAWILWVASYNSCNDCTYFSTRIFPLWDLSSQQISEVIRSIRTLWLPDYFHWTMLSLAGFGLILIIRFRKNLPREVIGFNLLLALGALIYVLLQFFTFRDHDYYVIDLYIIWIAIILEALYILKNHFSVLYKSKWIKITWIILLGFNVYYAAGRQSYRYKQWPNQYAKEYKALYNSEPFLRNLGVSHQDTVVFLPDPTNVSLYLMNQKGWTQYTDQRFHEGKPVRYNQDASGLNHSIEKGAKYLIIKDLSVLSQFDWLAPYAKHLMGEHNNMLVFDLRNETVNFNLQESKFTEVFYFSMEDLTQGMYESQTNQLKLPEMGSQDSSMAFSGKYSCKLDPKNPYGLTYEFNHFHKWNQQYQIEVLTTGNEKAGVVMALDESGEFYQMMSDGERVKNTNWRLIKWIVTIPPQFHGKKFKLYLYNPSENTAWFDDFRFTSVEVGEVKD